MSVLDKYLSDRIKKTTKDSPKDLSTEKIVDKFKDSDIGFESLINPQLNDPFPIQAGSLLEDLSHVLDTRKADNVLSELAKLIKNRFGIPVELKLSSGYAAIPLGIVDSVLTQDFINKIVKNSPEKNDKVLMDISKYLKSISFYVDRNKAKLIGIPNELKAVIHIDANEVYKITSGEDNDKIIKENVAALLHEIGHIFTYYETIGRTVKYNTGLLESLILYTQGYPDKAKTKLLKITNVKNTDNNKTIIYNGINEIISPWENMVHLTNDKNIATDSESLADSFSTYFGYGDYLVNSLYRDAKDDINLMYVFWFFILVYYPIVYATILMLFSKASIIAIISSSAILPIVFIIMGGFATVFSMLYTKLYPLYSDYEPLYNRIEKIKLETIKMLRTYNINKKDTKRLLDSIDKIEKNMKEISKDPKIMTWLGAFFTLGSTSRVKKDDVNNLMHILEKLENNDLHYLGKKLELGNESIFDGIKNIFKKKVNNVEQLLEYMEKSDIELKIPNTAPIGLVKYIHDKTKYQDYYKMFNDEIKAKRKDTETCLNPDVNLIYSIKDYKKLPGYEVNEKNMCLFNLKLTDIVEKTELEKIYKRDKKILGSNVVYKYFFAGIGNECFGDITYVYIILLRYVKFNSGYLVLPTIESVRSIPIKTDSYINLSIKEFNKIKNINTDDLYFRFTIEGNHVMYDYEDEDNSEYIAKEFTKTIPRNAYDIISKFYGRYENEFNVYHKSDDLEEIEMTEPVAHYYNILNHIDAILSQNCVSNLLVNEFVDDIEFYLENLIKDNSGIIGDIINKEIKLGNEGLETGYEDYVVITGNNEANRVLETTADEAIPELNKVLSKYGIQVDPKTKYFVLVEPIKFKTGINSIVWMISNSRVLVITTERIKTMWYEECPYIEVFNKAAIKVNNTKTMFIYEINRLKTVEEIKDAKLLKIVDDILFWFDRSYTLYDNDNLKKLNYIIKNLKDYGDKYKDVVIQLELMKDVVRRYNQEFENRRVILDAHYGNFGVDDEKHLVMFDILYTGKIGEESEN